jgi:hypothetical protein
MLGTPWRPECTAVSDQRVPPEPTTHTSHFQRSCPGSEIPHITLKSGPWRTDPAPRFRSERVLVYFRGLRLVYLYIRTSNSPSLDASRGSGKRTFNSFRVSLLVLEIYVGKGCRSSPFDDDVDLRLLSSLRCSKSHPVGSQCGSYQTLNPKGPRRSVSGDVDGLPSVGT